jgi:hypothetical protein
MDFGTAAATRSVSMITEPRSKFPDFFGFALGGQDPRDEADIREGPLLEMREKLIG